MKACVGHKTIHTHHNLYKLIQHILLTYAFIKYIISLKNAIIINLVTPECLVVWQIIIGYAARGTTLLSFRKTLAQDLVVTDAQ